MKIIIAKNSAAVDYITPYLVAGDSGDAASLADDLKNAYRAGADNIFLSLILDGSDVKAFILAYEVKGSGFCNLHQLWMKDDVSVPSMWLDSMLLRLVMWAEARGLSQLRADTRNSSKALLKSKGFVKHSLVLAYEIPENFEEELLKGREMLLKSRDVKDAKAAEPPNEDITPKLTTTVLPPVTPPPTTPTTEDSADGTT